MRRPANPTTTEHSLRPPSHLRRPPIRLDPVLTAAKLTGDPPPMARVSGIGSGASGHVALLSSDVQGRTADSLAAALDEAAMELPPPPLASGEFVRCDPSNGERDDLESRAGPEHGVVRQSSGSADPISMGDLASKSLFLMRPSMMHYTGTRDELLEAASEVFANMVCGVLHICVKHTYPLPEVSRAHADLEVQKMPGSILLIP